jgi:transposase-like protein
MVEEMLAARGIGVSYETVRQWAQPVAGFSVYGPRLDRARRGKWIGATALRGGNSPLM